MSTRQSLAQSPSGFAGMLFGKLMEWINSSAYRKALKALKPISNERYLEIGFGTGLFAEMLLSSTPNAMMAGIDPTPTMVQTAQKRLTKRGFGQQIDIREGTDETLAWSDNYFDAVVAIHSFQFWKDPAHTIKEIHRILKADGRVVIVFRHHSSNPPALLPNPISRSGKEIEMAMNLLEQNGFHCKEYPAAGRSRIVRADHKKGESA